MFDGVVECLMAIMCILYVKHTYNVTSTASYIEKTEPKWCSTYAWGVPHLHMHGTTYACHKLMSQINRKKKKKERYC